LHRHLDVHLRHDARTQWLFVIMFNQKSHR
jgi:hypothetical protein